MSPTIHGTGFTVILSGRCGLQYIEGQRTMDIDGEMLVGPFDFVVYRSSLGLWSDGTTADPREREIILNRLAVALEEAGVKVIFE